MNHHRIRPCLWLMVAMLALAIPALAAWKEKVLYSFQYVPDGATPVGGIVFDAAGNLYGATTQGGSASCRPFAQCGIVFQLAPPAKKGDPWTETVLYIFKGNGFSDGALPAGGLIIDSAGNLYGTTAYGGTGNCVLLGILAGCGTVFELSPPKRKGGAWTETVLYSFPTAKQGYLPNGDLVFDSAGNLYGATEFGGGHGMTCNGFYQYCGAVFELSPPKTKGGKWTEKVLHGFSGIASGKQSGDGASPNGEVALDSKGVIYGTTQIGGYNCAHHSSQGCGTVFRLNPPTESGGRWSEERIHVFKDSSDGATPAAGVVLAPNGNIAGTSQAGGRVGYGTVFELKGPTSKNQPWSEKVLYQFSNDQNGATPTAGVIFDATGNLYGTALGGATHRGIIFRLKPPKQGNLWPLTILYNFKGAPDGDHPTASLIFDNKGNLYSTTEWGGTGQSCQGGCGTVFEVLP